MLLLSYPKKCKKNTDKETSLSVFHTHFYFCLYFINISFLMIDFLNKTESNHQSNLRMILKQDTNIFLDTEASRTNRSTKTSVNFSIYFGSNSRSLE